MSRPVEQALPDATPESPDQPLAMSHRQILEVLLGLVLAMFVAVLSSTVVANALPTILHDLDGTQNQYTWVVAMTMLVATSSTPLWGKSSDLVDKKLLLQIALLTFVAGSVLAGLAQNTEQLLVFRGIQGLGLGGLQSLTQVVLAAIISPRQRGRYSGYLGASFAVGATGGPLIGGLIVGTSWLGWRWCFYICVPLAIIALVVLQRTLKLPHFRRKVKIDIFGSTFLIGGVSLLLIWVSLAGDGDGKSFAWMSGQSAAFVGGALLCLALAVLIESRVSEPVIPLRLFRNRTVALAILASLCTGVLMMSSGIFLAEYFQVSLGYTPLQAGLLGFPMVIGLMGASTISGQLITRSGRWKRYLIGGMTCCLIGFGGLSLLTNQTPLWVVLGLQFVAGVGLGMNMQNVILAVQNSVDARDLGSASSTVMFFRSLGGASGVSILGAVLADRVGGLTKDGLSHVTITPNDATALTASGVPKLSELSRPVADVVSESYGNAMSLVFLIMIPLAVVALICFVFIKEIPLLTQSGIQREAVERAEEERAEVERAQGMSVDAPGAVPALADVSRNGHGVAANGAAANGAAANGNGAANGSANGKNCVPNGRNSANGHGGPSTGHSLPATFVRTEEG